MIYTKYGGIAPFVIPHRAINTPIVSIRSVRVF